MNKSIKVGMVIGGLVAVSGVALFAVKKTKDRPDYEVKEYIIGDQDDAENVLDMLNELAEKYDNISAVDYYNALGESSTYKDNVYGWSAKAIKRAKVIKVRGGYAIKFPQVDVVPYEVQR